MSGVKFDPTVNLGHILSAGTFLVAMAVGWTTLDARATRLEERTARLEAQRDRDDRETAVNGSKIAEMAARLEATQRVVVRIEGLLDQQRNGRQ